MIPKISDTDAKAEEVRIRILRAMPIWQKARLWNGLQVTVRKLALAGLRRRFPDATQDELHRRQATLLLGPELAMKIYGRTLKPSSAPSIVAQDSSLFW